MTFNPRGSIQDGLDLLSKRLDAVITTKLADSLQGLEWTIILRELDRAKGHTSREYSVFDLQAQLRMMTERLGGLGHPFDDPRTRVVTTLGGELRIMRNRWAHGYDLTVLDAWRTHDFVVRLLEHFGDSEGLEPAIDFRQAALAEVAKEAGVWPPAAMAVVEATVERAAITRAATPDFGASEVEVSPDPSVMLRRDGAETPRIGAKRTEYEPWSVVVVGEPSVLEELPKKAAKDQVRSIALEIAEYEGPIHIDRLAELIAASFRLKKLHSKRRGQINRQIAAAGLLIDADKFVWPSTITPEDWREFRPNSSELDRAFTRISPIEIRNAARFIRTERDPVSQGELEALTLQTFGRKRRTIAFVQHLQRALSA